MPVWQKAKEAMKEIYRLAGQLPKHEIFAMGQQMREAALSMPGNIAEAFGRHHSKDKINFYYFSRGSAYESVSHLLCAIEVDYYTPEEILTAHRLCNEVIEDLNKIIKALG